MSHMSLTVRPLVADDAAAARQLSYEAFGVPSTAPTEPARIDQPGRTWFGGFDGNELVGQLIDRSYDSWFGGVPVPTSGIAAVTVAAEHRGRGALTPMFEQALAYARERGAVISGLFPSAPRIYRRFGYELITDYVSVELPIAALAAVYRPDSVRCPRLSRAADDGAVWTSQPPELSIDSRTKAGSPRSVMMTGLPAPRASLYSHPG